MTILTAICCRSLLSTQFYSVFFFETNIDLSQRETSTYTYPIFWVITLCSNPVICGLNDLELHARESFGHLGLNNLPREALEEEICFLIVNRAAESCNPIGENMSWITQNNRTISRHAKDMINLVMVIIYAFYCILKADWHSIILVEKLDN